MRSIWSKTLFDRKRASLWWTLGFLALTTSIISIFPSVRASPEIDEFTRQLPDALKALIGERSLTSPVGYLQSRLFQLIVPLLMLVIAIGQGADAIAGEEDRGTLDLLLAHPVSRRRVVAEKAAALAAQLVGLGTVLFLSLVILTPIFGARLSVAGLAAACMNAVVLAMAFGAGALALGAATGNRALAVGVSTALAAATYIWQSLSLLVPGLEGLAWISPFHHYVVADPLIQGINVPFVLACLVAGLTLVAAAAATFERRDLHS